MGDTTYRNSRARAEADADRACKYIIFILYVLLLLDLVILGR